MSYGLALYERYGPVAIVRLNRPDKGNAYTPEMGEDLVALIRRGAEDESVRAIVLTGSGKRFCMGADLECFRGGTGPSGYKIGEEAFIRAFPEELARLPKLTIAAFNGDAAGLGITCTLACDVRLSVPDATFKLNFADLGILPGLGSTASLPQLLGLSRAKQLLLCERSLTAQNAHLMGLIDELVPRERLMDRALELGEAVAQISPKVAALIKKGLNEGAGMDVKAAMARETALYRELQGS